jgi:hypothetical protein
MEPKLVLAMPFNQAIAGISFLAVHLRLSSSNFQMSTKTFEQLYGPSASLPSIEHLWQFQSFAAIARVKTASADIFHNRRIPDFERKMKRQRILKSKLSRLQMPTEDIAILTNGTEKSKLL